jgi:hypothetical protein
MGLTSRHEIVGAHPGRLRVARREDGAIAERSRCHYPRATRGRPPPRYEPGYAVDRLKKYKRLPERCSGQYG